MILLYLYQKIRTNLEIPCPEVDVNKVHPEEKRLEIYGHFSYTEKNYNELKFHKNKQSEEKVLIDTDVKSTIETLYDEGFSGNYDNTGEVLKDYLFNKVKKKHRLDLDPMNDIMP